MFDRNRETPDRYQAPGQPVGPTQRPNAGAPWMTPAGRTQAADGALVTPREGFLTMAFVWMFFALLASAAAAAFVLANPNALEFVVRNYLVLILLELGFVFAIGLVINRIGAVPGLGLLFAYAVLNGATLAIVALVYTTESVLSAFLGASAIFGGAALYGVTTGRDLTRLGGILFMGVLGIVVVSLLQVFLFPSSGPLNWIIGVAGVVIFTGLTAYDVQRIRNGDLQWIQNRESASVVGALHLYLDFVNIFISLLRIFGDRR